MKRFKIKTEILFGEGALDYLKELKNKKVFIVTDPFMVKSGTIEKLTNNLTSSEVFVFSEIVPDPPIELVLPWGTWNFPPKTCAIPWFTPKEASLKAKPAKHEALCIFSLASISFPFS